MGATLIISSNSTLGSNTTTTPLFSTPTLSTPMNFKFPIYSIPQSHFTAVKNQVQQTSAFFVKTNQKFKFGAYYRNINSKEQKIKDTESGVIITIVIENSPASNSKLQTGDIVTSLNGKKIDTHKDMNHILKLVSEVKDVSIIRKNEKVKIKFAESSRNISSKE